MAQDLREPREPRWWLLDPQHWLIVQEQKTPVACYVMCFVVQLCLHRVSYIMLHLHTLAGSCWCLAGNGWEWGNGMIIDSYCGSFPHSLLSTSKYIYAPRSSHRKTWKKHQGASATASSVWSWPATFRRFLATNTTPLPQWSWVPCHALVPEISENANWKMGIEADWKLKT